MTVVAINPTKADSRTRNFFATTGSSSTIPSLKEGTSQYSIATIGGGERPLKKDPTTRKEQIRKLRGQVIQFETETVTVVLRDDVTGKAHNYRFPADRFFEAKISVENQPFELIESKISSEHSAPIYQTMFIPAAPAESAELVDMDLGEEHETMKKNILARRVAKKAR